ncbi:helix-turn-helix domain-containing protein [Ferrovibrio terrae]|uniref:Helix-turn-helix domain-containing protein n=1 Tax=Ferrovibrio terrae TaxID=2594003 RepID=A0A516H5L2_9PROT|nr:helix-turn-helix domain-containing protein [Ferrovibrio terrae]QDO99093.1 helix-turn-helix domain-containing protein [Ferrovibrio terrae]
MTSTDAPLSPEQLAKRWGVSPRHVRGMIARGELKAFKLGAKIWRIAAVEVARVEALIGNPEPPATGDADASIDVARQARRLK